MMTTHGAGASVGLVGAGAMGSALGAGWLAGGATVRTCLAGRSERTRELARAAGIEPVDSLDDLVAGCTLVVSVLPPGDAPAAAREVAAAAERTAAHPLVADLNAISPGTVAALGRVLAEAGLDLVDGSISGGPPAPGRPTRVYLSGPRAGEVPPNPWLDVVLLDGGAGAASALKMCTASMYKGSKALVMQAMLTARRHGVLDEFLADTARAWPEEVSTWHTDVALAAAKAARFVDEMHEIARTQRGAGLPGELFEGMAAAWERAARTPLGERAPERVDRDATVGEVLDDLAVSDDHGLPGAVLFDFSGTLFHIETAEEALLGALGPQFVALAPAMRHFGAINGSLAPTELPAELADAWDSRDLSAEVHRAAYSGLSRQAGLSSEQADMLYERGTSPASWHPYPDTVRVLRELHERGVPVAVVSNIGWDPRPVLARYGADRDVDALVLSYERGVLKPDAEIFRQACVELGVDPADAVMVGDNPEADGGATALGTRFVAVSADPAQREPEALRRAVGLTG